MNRLIIIGASGHGKVVADIAALNGYEDIVFLDNDSAISSCSGYPVLGPDTMTAELDGDVFIAVGNAKIRQKLMERDAERTFPVLVHPNAVVAKGVEIGEGSVVMAGAVINPGAKIGKGCIINTSSSVDHDSVVSDYCHVSVGAHISGTVVVGTGTWIGAGATVSNNINICGGCLIGAGAVVIKDINEPGTYVGVPVKISKKG
jgi:sugar O-acyltransferase (sialic acid O-acetyltransferase NeuD family)